MQFKKWLEKSSFTVTTLSRAMGVSRQCIYYWIEGRKTPSHRNLLKLDALSTGQLGARSDRPTAGSPTNATT